MPIPACHALLAFTDRCCRFEIELRRQLRQRTKDPEVAEVGVMISRNSLSTSFTKFSARAFAPLSESILVIRAFGSMRTKPLICGMIHTATIGVWCLVPGLLGRDRHIPRQMGSEFRIGPGVDKGAALLQSTDCPSLIHRHVIVNEACPKAIRESKHLLMSNPTT